MSDMIATGPKVLEEQKGEEEQNAATTATTDKTKEA